MNDNLSRLFLCVRLLAGLVVAGAIVVMAEEPLQPMPADLLPERTIPALAQLLDTALRQSPTMLGKSVELAQAEAELVMSKSQLLPSLNLSASGQYQVISLTNQSGDSNSGEGFFYSLNARQPIYQWGALRSAVKIEQIDLSLKKRDFAAAYQQLAENIRSQYLALILQKKRLAFIDYSAGLVHEKYEQLKTKQQAGTASSGDMYSAELDDRDGQIAVKRARLEFDNAKKVLASLVGGVEITDDIIGDTIPRWPAIPKSYVSQILGAAKPVEDTPDALVYADRIKQAELRYDIAKVRLRPMVSLLASTGLDNTVTANSRNVDQYSTYRHSVGISVNWAIFDGFATRGSKQAALASKRTAELQREGFLQTARRVRQLSGDQLALMLEQEELAQVRYSNSVAGFEHAQGEVRAGRWSDTFLSQTKLGMLNLEIAALNARMDLYNKWADVLGQIGDDPALKKAGDNLQVYGR